MILIGSLLLLAALSSQSEKQIEYLNLAAATLAHPVTHAELSHAVLSTDGIAAIRTLFEQSLAESLTVNGALVTPELGGESMLGDDGRLGLVVYPDPIHPVLRELATRKDDPEELLRFLESSAEGRFLLKNTGGLHALLYQMTSSPNSPTKAQREVLDDVTGRTVAEHFKTWTTDPLIQAQMIEKTEWKGRYIGFWHIHPPRLKGASPTEGIEPSMADMRNAVDLGQFVTIVFQPDGFDVYDLSPLAALGHEDLSRAETIIYRSPAWKPHFASQFSIAQSSSTP
ncbi:MAG: hypothetical protein BMS9Abin37_3289 [Acidobacteriota bacterium]|nr:MAG: hypothetical protein BMS9Abin37_3289 [Acidobacteriota bacterium]